MGRWALKIGRGEGGGEGGREGGVCLSREVGAKAFRAGPSSSLVLLSSPPFRFFLLCFLFFFFCFSPPSLGLLGLWGPCGRSADSVLRCATHAPHETLLRHTTTDLSLTHFPSEEPLSVCSSNDNDRGYRPTNLSSPLSLTNRNATLVEPHPPTHIYTERTRCIAIECDPY